jgi:signal transduction histidine kinase
MDINQDIKSKSLIIRKYLRRAIIGVERVSRIMNYTIDTQYKNYNQDCFNIKSELINVIKSFEIRSQIENVELCLRCEITNKLTGSKNAFHRILGNLIANGFDAFQNHKYQCDKVLKIKAHTSGNYLIITFEDNAGGIPCSIQKHLFKEQYTTKSKGNGLGLISIKALVEDHFGGFLNCYSIKGQGTVFAIALPLLKSN